MNLILVVYFLIFSVHFNEASSLYNERKEPRDNALYRNTMQLLNRLNKDSVEIEHHHHISKNHHDSGFENSRLKHILSLIQKNYDAEKLENEVDNKRIYIIRNPEVLEEYMNYENKKRYSNPDDSNKLNQYYLEELRRFSNDNGAKEEMFSSEKYHDDGNTDQKIGPIGGAGNNINFQDEKETVDVVTKRYKKEMKREARKRVKKDRNKQKRWEESRVTPKKKQTYDWDNMNSNKHVSKYQANSYNNNQSVKKNRLDRFKKIAPPRDREKRDWNTNRNDWQERSKKKFVRNREGMFGRTPIPYVGKKGIYEDK